MTFKDISLNAKVKSALAMADDVSAMDIDVDVQNGVVRLSGDVSQQAHDTALQVTKSVEGVTEIEDNLNIRSHM